MKGQGKKIEGKGAGAEVEAQEHLIVFRLENEEYGAPITQVREIRRMGPITPMPKAPPAVKGVINLRGKIVPIVDLKQRLEMPTQEPTSSTRIVVAEIGEDTVGFIVDSVSEVLQLSPEEVEPPPEVTRQEHITGIGKVGERLIVLLNLERVLGEDQ